MAKGWRGLTGKLRRTWEGAATPAQRILQRILFALALTTFSTGLWLTGKGAPLLCGALTGGGIHIAFVVIRRWPFFNEADAAKRLASSGRAKTMRRAFEAARDAWRLSVRGTLPEANALARMAELLNNQGRAREAKALLAKIPKRYTPPALIVVETHLIQGDSTAVLHALDTLGETSAHALHSRVRALLQLKQVDAAEETLTSAADICIDAFHEFQILLLEGGDAARSMRVGDLGMKRIEHPMGAHLLAQAGGRLGDAAAESSWEARARALGFTEAASQALRTTLIHFRLLTPGPADVPRPRLDGDLELQGPVESPAEFAARWIFVTTLTWAVAHAVSSLSNFIWDPRAMATPALVTLIDGALLGGLCALPQYFLLRRILPGTSWWIAAGLLGGLGGNLSTLSYPMLQVFLTSVLGRAYLFSSSAMLLTAAAQSLILPRWFPRARAWLPVVAVALILGELVARKVPPLPFPPGPVPVWAFVANSALRGLFEGLLVSVPTAFLLVRWLADWRASRNPAPPQMSSDPRAFAKPGR